MEFMASVLAAYLCVLTPLVVLISNSNGTHPSGVLSAGVPPAIKPGNVPTVPLVPAIPRPTNDILDAGPESVPALDITQGGDGAKSTNGQSVVEDKAQNEDFGTSKETREDAKPEEPRDDKNGEDVAKTAGEETTQAGDKRKADEKDVPEQAASTEETKKQKTSNSTAATNGSKEEPGASKATERKAPGPKKEKKVLRTGTAERKTRSQGTAPDSGL